MKGWEVTHTEKNEYQKIEGFVLERFGNEDEFISISNLITQLETTSKKYVIKIGEEFFNIQSKHVTPECEGRLNDGDRQPLLNLPVYHRSKK